MENEHNEKSETVTTELAESRESNACKRSSLIK